MDKEKITPIQIDVEVYTHKYYASNNRNIWWDWLNNHTQDLVSANILPLPGTGVCVIGSVGKTAKYLLNYNNGQLHNPLSWGCWTNGDNWRMSEFWLFGIKAPYTIWKEFNKQYMKLDEAERDNFQGYWLSTHTHNNHYWRKQ